MVRTLTQAGQTIHSVHDAEGNRLAEYDWDASTSTATLLREYVWFDGVPVAGAGGATEGGGHQGPGGQPSVSRCDQTRLTGLRVSASEPLDFGLPARCGYGRRA